MNKVGSYIAELHDAETALAADFRKVGERHAAEHDLWYGCHTLSQQCRARAAQLRPFAQRYGENVDEPHESELLRSVMRHVRQAASDMTRHRPSSGLLMLADLRRLHTAAEEVNFYWIGLGQVAQAKRDRELLETVEILHREEVTQIKWIKTHLKASAAQILLA